MTNVRRKAVKYILFDVDGLLLDTEIIYTEVTQKIVSRFGKTYDWSIKANMIGRGAEASSRYLVETLDLPITPQQYLEERTIGLKEGFKTCNALPGAERLVRHLHQHQIPMAVATSSTLDLFNIKKVKHASWLDLVETVVTRDNPEVTHAKPSPDIFNTAANKIGADPAETLVFEDAPSGLEAGLAAGMRVIVVPDANMDKARYHGHDAMLTSLEQFEPTDYGLPTYV